MLDLQQNLLNRIDQHNPLRVFPLNTEYFAESVHPAMASEYESGRNIEMGRVDLLYAEHVAFVFECFLVATLTTCSRQIYVSIQ